MTVDQLEITDPQLWRLPLDERMAHFIGPREAGPFWKASFFNPMLDAEEHFYAVTRFDEVV
ncbi:hypothetical protein B7486_75305, partial [cyanobacterium TDX16]